MMAARHIYAVIKINNGRKAAKILNIRHVNSAAASVPNYTNYYYHEKQPEIPMILNKQEEVVLSDTILTALLNFKECELKGHHRGFQSPTVASIEDTQSNTDSHNDPSADSTTVKGIYSSIMDSVRKYGMFVAVGASVVVVAVVSATILESKDEEVMAIEVAYYSSMPLLFWVTQQLSECHK